MLLYKLLPRVQSPAARRLLRQTACRWYASDTLAAGSAVWSNALSMAYPEPSSFNQQPPDADSAHAVEHSWWLPDESQRQQQDWFWSHFTRFFYPRDHNKSTTTTTTTKTTPVLPKTLQQALSLQNAAVVVTTAAPPQVIVHVNAAWEHLCGYSQHTALHQRLDQLLQGPDSNSQVARDLVQRVLLRNKQHPTNDDDDKDDVVVDAYLINYTASGRRFTNHVSIGPCRFSDQDDNDTTTVPLLVGILEEVDPSQVPLRMVG